MAFSKDLDEDFLVKNSGPIDRLDKLLDGEFVVVQMLLQQLLLFCKNSWSRSWTDRE
jgi:hypothetical protein